ncbi:MULTISPECIES: hypothetical protein [Thermus]|uniref:Uncharacterized protein n=1 Tax=Thermus caliditerrae TaxID=1330700 RepID=A0A7C5RDZ5_9DEIN|nr:MULTISPECIES: hypothetical protein [unclassified Thermus]MDW8358095.1 hypothetical protein [Thermus sp.]
MARKKDPNPNLEPFLPDGRPRCQARSKSTGAQCRQPAVRGYSVCHVHGAGTRKRVAEGARKPPGRPVVHGLYSERHAATLRALYEEVLALGDLDATDRDVAVLKAVVWYLLNGAGRVEEWQGRLEGLFARLEEAGAEEARPLLYQVERLMQQTQSYLDRLAEHAFRVVQAVKTRAETEAKRAETKALAYLLRFVDELKAVLVERLEPEVYEAVLEDLQKRVLAKALPQADP